MQLDNTGGGHTKVGPGNVLGGLADAAGGYVPGLNEEWAGNISHQEGPITKYYVDCSHGLDIYNGLSWLTAFKTIQAAMDAITARGTLRGRSEVYVAPGGYVEDIVTPLNSIAPFGKLIACNPHSESRGAVWLFSKTATEPCLTIRARGWLIDGFEFDANSGAGGGCIKMDDGTSSADAGTRMTEIRNCLFVGGKQAGDYGIWTTGPSALALIHHNSFYSFGGEAITATHEPIQWKIYNNWFSDNQKHIAPQNTKGFQEAWIYNNLFQEVGGTYTTTIKIDMRGGAGNYVGPNNLMAGDYSEADGYYAAGNDVWRGNHTQDSDNATVGTGQVNPA